MQASSQRTEQVRLALMLILGVAAAAACVVTLLWWKAPAASGQETTPTEPSFVVLCDFSLWAQVDPIYPSLPDQPPDQRYQREFFGSTHPNPTATYAQLLAGDTNCDDPKDTARYWIPRVFWTDSSGTRALTASITRFYYRLGEKSTNVTVKPHPAQLKIDTERGKNVEWRCMNTGAWLTTPPAQCSNGKLVVRIKFPDCSNGKLDSLDHRSHMAYAQVPANGGKATCPTSHPIPVPRLQTNVEFPIPPGTSGEVTLSTASDTSGAYTTMHSAFFNAWDQQRLQRLVNRCINAAPFTDSNPKPTVCL
jgi:Domain of unknown function (DUF1996)